MDAIFLNSSIGRSLPACDDLSKTRSVPDAGRRKGNLRRIGLLAALLTCLPLAMLAQQTSVERTPLSCNSRTIMGGGTETCRVTLSAAERSDKEQVVTLSSSNAAVTVPETVTMAKGEASAEFTATAAAVTEEQFATLTARSEKAEWRFELHLKPAAPAVSRVSCESGSVRGAMRDGCTVTLVAPAPESGTKVLLSSDSAAVAVPATVTVEPGATSASFTATTAPVTTEQTATVTASTNGGVTSFPIGMHPGQPGITVTPNGVSFGSVNLNTPATQVVTVMSSGTTPLQITSATLGGGAGFSVSGLSTPLTLNPGQSATLSIQFDPTVVGASNATLTLMDDASFGMTVLPLSGIGASTTAVSGLSCSSGSETGAASDACVVILSSPAPSGGFTVNLSSSNAAVTVPAAVSVAAGAESAWFTAAVAAVTTPQAATLTASGGGASANFALQLTAAAPGLTLSTSALNFGNTNLNTAAMQSVTVTSSGTSPVTISAAAISGAGFNMAGLSTPVTLNPGQTAEVTVQFDPTVAGAAQGAVTLTSNATPSSASISLSGTGVGPAALSGVSCSAGTETGAASDACAVTLSAAAPTGGFTVNLSSNNSSVTVPASVTVAAGATSAAFTATVSAVTTAQTATLTAAASGVTKTFALQLSASVPGLTLSSSSLSFGQVNVNTPTTQSVTLTSSGTAALTISAAAATGTGFSVSGLSLPVTLNPGQTATLTVQFDPTAAGAMTGAVTLTDNTSAGTAAISLSGTGLAPGALSAVSCSAGTETGAASDACTVTLSAAAPTGGLAVNLSSSSSSVTVPASATVAAGATTAAFTATVSAVTTTQTATLTATASGVTKTFALQLNAAVPGLTLGASSVNFGDVNLNTPTTQSVTLTSSGTAALTISAASITGTGFSMSGVTAPLTLNPGQEATLEVEFDPTVSGAATGTVTLSSNVSGGASTVALSGTGQAASYQVQLSWIAPSGTSDPVVGYNIYRAASGGSYQLLNTSVNAPASYTDSSVTNGTAYTYYVESVDAEGNQSAPSNTYSVTIP